MGVQQSSTGIINFLKDNKDFSYQESLKVIGPN